MIPFSSVRKRSIDLDSEKLDSSTSLFDSVSINTSPNTHIRRQELEDQRRRTTHYNKRRLVAISLIFVGIAIGWNLKDYMNPRRHHLEPSLRQKSRTIDPKISCDPYSYRGYLLTNKTVPEANTFRPISAPPHCQPVDYFSPIGGTPPVNLDFARDKVIVLFGDSLDRNHLLHPCKFFFKGELEMIGEDHELNPPYPFDPHPSIIPPGIAWDANGTRHWPSWELARPWICTVPRLNLRIVSVFHFGFVENSDHIVDDHYYPPAKLEDRFDTILVPIMKKMSELYGTSEAPDIVSVTPGFWGIMRRVIDDDAKAMELQADGYTEDETDALHLNAWEQMNMEEHDYLLGKFRGFINQVADAWPNAKLPPKILWRGLHHIQYTRKVPFNRVQAVDQIARAVVEDLIEEAKIVKSKASRWFSPSAEDALVLSRGLERRLEFDEWASFLIGYEGWFEDSMHPLPFPGSWLYAQRFMSKLKILTEERLAGYM